MASIFRRAASGVYTVLAVSILGVWSLIVLVGVGLTAVDANASLLQLIALPSLLTFLVAKLVVAASRLRAAAAAAAETLQPGSRRRTTAPRTARSFSSSSPVTWLLHLARIVFALFLVVLMGGFMAFAATLDGAGKAGNSGSGGGGTTGGRGALFDDDADAGGARQNMTMALARFEEQAGVVGIGDYLKGNPWIVFQVFAALWATCGLLTAYVTAYAFGAARTVLMTPLDAWVRRGGGGGGSGGVPSVVVVVEKERVVLPVEASS
ncbi:uncharacterized protein GLRG_01152 [Colletotrichum graminicola M1.001]|uniref:Uncharacterized protein n=1 Tax=Colletotrichum graminicola (strain M1.001 / M2 / FGSC 10212) TaxID=645133 RepID=E3Q4J3_COLGM|nr:uncharacterized protein GLRG_01152 [Colletotrichum graminicola M1.001]EFQ26008.1 hypothetical protein GLRG_01152 [Colletotrichum graminicola M1.001]